MTWLVQGLHGFDLFLAAQHATLEFEVVEAVAPVGSLGQAHDGLGGQRLHGLQGHRARDGGHHRGHQAAAGGGQAAGQAVGHVARALDGIEHLLADFLGNLGRCVDGT